MTEKKQQHKRMHIGTKLKTKNTGWSIPEWMVAEVDHVAQNQNVSSSQIIRNLLIKEFGFHQSSRHEIITKKQGRPQIIDATKKSKAVSWSMPQWIIDYVHQEAEEIGELPSRVARRIIEEAIQQRHYKEVSKTSDFRI